MNDDDDDVNEPNYDINEDDDALIESEYGEINSNARDRDVNEKGSKGVSDDNDGYFGRWDDNEALIDRNQQVCFNVDD